MPETTDRSPAERRLIPRYTLSLAAEFAVASELCRRGAYAQLTLGNYKRTDLLVETKDRLLRIQVKAKQGRVWPGSRGVYGEGIVLVSVDYEGKALTERPDFYILTPADWRVVVTKELIDTGRVRNGEVTLSEELVPTFKDGYVGWGVKPPFVAEFKEAWQKIVAAAPSRA